MEAYGKFAYVYDELMADMPYPAWLRFAEEAWEKYGRPHTVAELGCGTGSLTIPLAASGLDVTAIDLSPDMLAVARSKQEERSGGRALPGEGTIHWIQQDMREWELPEPVDAVLSFCDCLNYVLEEEEVTSVFARTYEGLKEGGLFLFDVHHPDTLVRYAEEQPFVLDEPSVSYIWTCGLDEERTEIEHALTIFARERDGSGLYRRFEETHLQRAYDPAWMTAELRRAGFSRVEVYADFKWHPFDPEAVTGEEHDKAARLFYVAVK